MQNLHATRPGQHVFCIAAYGESPYLEECLASIAKQSVPARMILCTSTPNNHISLLADKYGAMYKIGHHAPGIGRDWNFAYHTADTQYVTIAHQDDIYETDYLKQVLQALDKHSGLLLLFTDYRQLINNIAYAWQPVVFIKRLLVFPFWFSPYLHSRFLRKLVFCFGNPVSCPSVVLNKSALPENFAFDETMKTNLDWLAWIELSNIPGGFYRVPRRLVQHRTHAGSATSDTILSDARQQEDQWIFEKLWGRSLAQMILFFYRASYWLNRITTK
jgi:glycosyltransferase involved in cell wall biosynthesis